MNVPGAEISGFTRPSSTGPRLENAAIPLMLSALKSLLIGDPYELPQIEFIVGRSFSLAPIEKTFFAVAGFPNESKSISPFELASIPELPAENKIVMFVYSLAAISACIDPKVYSLKQVLLQVLPHELVWTREPFSAPNLNKSVLFVGIPISVFCLPTALFAHHNPID